MGTDAGDRDIDTVVVGTEVYGSDDEKVGVVGEVGSDYLLVEAGLLTTKKFHVPTANIARVGSRGAVHLCVPTSQVTATDP